MMMNNDNIDTRRDTEGEARQETSKHDARAEPKKRLLPNKFCLSNLLFTSCLL